jgi:nucleoid DNA-binding protein
LDLKRIIKEVLRKNNFVSLPGLGSFTKSYESARLSSDELQFIPPKLNVSFDRSRSFNDEAIENYLKDKYGLSPADATKVTVEFVEKVNESIQSGIEDAFFLFKSTKTY